MKISNQNVINREIMERTRTIKVYIVKNIMERKPQLPEEIISLSSYNKALIKKWVENWVVFGHFYYNFITFPP